MSDSLWPHELQHARLPCPSPTPRVHPNSCASSWWCHPAISSSVIPFASCPPSLSASDSFPMSQLFAWGGQSTGCNLAITPPTSSSRLIQLFPNPHKRKIKQSPKMRLQWDLWGHGWLVNEHGQYFFPRTAACQVNKEPQQGIQVLYNRFIELMAISGIKSIISQT